MALWRGWLARRGASAGLAALLVAFLALSPALALGEVVDLAPGQAAPTAGLLFDLEALTRLIEVLRDGDEAKAVVETLRAALAAKDAESNALREALDRGKAEARAREEALIRSDEREKLRAESVALLKDALAEYRAALTEAREEIRALRKQAAWDRVLGAIPLVGAVLLLFGMGR